MIARCPDCRGTGGTAERECGTCGDGEASSAAARDLRLVACALFVWRQRVAERARIAPLSPEYERLALRHAEVCQ